MERRKKAKLRLCDYKTPYSVKGQLHLDISKITKAAKFSRKGSSVVSRKKKVTSKSDQSDCIMVQNCGVPMSGSTGQCYEDTSSLQMYQKMVQHLDAFVVLDTAMTMFAVLDFDQVKNEVKKVPILLLRNGNKFICQCNEERLNFSDNIPSCSNEEFDQLHPPCMHVHLVKDIYCTSLASKLLESNIEPSAGHDHGYCVNNLSASTDLDSLNVKWDLVELPFLEDNFFIRFDWKYSFLKILFGEIHCFRCKNAKNCCHVKYLNNLLSTYEINNDQPEVLEKIYQKVFSYQKKYQTELICLSTETIPFTLTPEMKMNITVKMQDLLPKIDGVLQAIPHYELCPYCGFPLNPEYQRELYQSKILTRYACETVQCYFKTCSNPICGKPVSFDGSKQCLLNMGKVLVHYEVLRDYMFHFLLSRTTMFSFYNVLEQHQIDGRNPDFKNIFPYNFFRVSWYSFQKNLDIDYNQGFMCTSCGQFPKILLFDGTSLSFQKQYITARLTSWTTDESKNDRRLPGSSHKERVFIADKMARTILKDFCKKTVEFDIHQFHQLKTAMEKHQPALVPLLNYLENIGCTTTCPDEFRDLLRTLSSNSPVCGSFSFQDLELLETVIRCKDNLEPKTAKKLQFNIPVLYKLFAELKEIPSCITVLLERVLQVARYPFLCGETHTIAASPEEDQFAFYPNLPKHSGRGCYMMDGKKTQATCSKKGGTHPSLLPGIFTVFCEHGICYGFEVMESVESPDRPFTFLKTRFVDPPALVIYDNACNLHSYCLNRDPWFFRNTKFRVDGLHWDGHIACSPAYEGLLYPDIKRINTQMVEQNNAKLKRLKPSLSYMKPENFMQTLKFFLWNCNRQTLKQQ